MTGNAVSWVQIGTVLYLDADGRDRELPHDGRGVLTWYGPDGEESWAPPEDEFKLAWDGQHKEWELWVRADSDTAAYYDRTMTRAIP